MRETEVGTVAECGFGNVLVFSNWSWRVQFSFDVAFAVARWVGGWNVVACLSIGS